MSILRFREAGFPQHVVVGVGAAGRHEVVVGDGAFDGTRASRKAMVQVHETAVERSAKSAKPADENSLSMFDAAELAEMGPPKPELPDVEDDRRESLEWEKETLGLRVSERRMA